MFFFLDYSDLLVDCPLPPPFEAAYRSSPPPFPPLKRRVSNPPLNRFFESFLYPFDEKQLLFFFFSPPPRMTNPAPPLFLFYLPFLKGIGDELPFFFVLRRRLSLAGG